MSNMSKRVLALALALVLMLANVPGNALTAFAAGTLETSVDGLGVAWTDATGNGTATWTADGTTINGALSVPARNANVTTLTLTNNLEEEAILSFDWKGTTPNSYSTITVNGVSYKGSASVTAPEGSVEVELASGETVEISLTGNRSSAKFEFTVQISNLDLYVDADVTTTFKAVDAATGSYTVNGTAINTDTQLTQKANDAYALEATPAEGYVFSGWYSETTGKFISSKTSDEVKLSEPQTVYPLFIPKAEAVWGVGEASFDNWNDAVTCAVNDLINKTVVLLQDHTLTESITVPAGITLLVPFDAENTCYYETPANTGLDYGDDQYVDGPFPWVVPYAYRTLTLGENVTVTVNGSMSVSAQHSPGNGSGQATAGSPSGPCGFVKTGSGSQIVINDGGALYAWGYIVGSGSVTANSGAAVYENIQFTDFRGGSASSAFLGAFEVFPFNQYYVQNIELPVKLYQGAKEVVYTSIYAANTANSTPIDFIGTDLSMFRMEDGAYIIKNYNGSKDRMEVSVYGDVSLNGLSVTLMDMTLDSSMFVLPITNNITVNVESGTTTINQNAALLPGAELNIAENATVNIADGWSVYVYDKDEWTSGYLLTKLAEGEVGDITDQSDVAYTISADRTTCKFVHVDVSLRPIAYSVANGTTAVRNESTLVDAKVNNNGTIRIDGYLYTTEGGANITSSGNGRIIIWWGNGEEEYTFQATQSGTNVTWAALPLTAPQLMNGNGSYTSTTDVDPDYGAAYTYVDGTWTEFTTLTLDPNGGTGADASVEELTIDVLWNTYYGEDYVIELPECTYTRTNGTFVEWNTKADGTGTGYQPGDDFTLNENATLYAIWNVTVPTYTVTWLDEDGNVVHTETVEEGASATETPAVPAKEGHTGAWDQEATNVTSDMTIKPVYSVISYKLTFVSGRTSKVIATYEIPYGTNLSTYVSGVSVPAIEGWTFKHWYVLSEGYQKEAQIPETMPAQDLEYYAYYERNVYTLTFDLDGGTTEDDTSFKIGYDQRVGHYGPTVTKEGHTFLYWADEDGNEVDVQMFIMPNHDVTLKAVYEANQYIVTIDGNTGWDTDKYTVGVKYGDSYTLPSNTYNRIGHTFKGWYVSGDPDTVYQPGATYTIKGDVTFIAKWEKNIYTLTFLVNGETVKTMDVEFNTYIDSSFLSNNAPAVNVEGYTLIGWRSADHAYDSFYMPAENVVLVASLNVNSYTITWTVNGEKYAETQVNYGSPITAPEYEVPVGYTFSGWDVPATMPADALTLDATLTVNSYKLTWVIDGVTTTETVAYGTALTAPAAPTKTGYTFTGWEGDTVPATMPAKDITITLKSTWSINKYTLTWVIDGVTTTETVEYNAEIKAPADPTKEGHTFTGWEGEIPATMPAEDTTITLKSTWSVNKYTLTWIVDGVTTTETVAYGTELTAPAAPTKTGYTFTGWEGEIPATMPANDITITLKSTWKISTYTITWLDDDGTVLGTTTVEHGTVPAFANPVKAPSAEYSYDFIGWTPEIVAATKDATYTATYAKYANLYTITWTINGEVYDTSRVPYGEVISAPEYTAAEGYKFYGWDVPATMPAEDITLDAKLTYTGWLTDDNGTTYVIEDVIAYKSSVAHIDGEAYLFDENGYIVAGAGLYRHVTEDGTVEYYYFMTGSYTAFKDGKLWVDDPAEQLPVWDYTFDERGVILHHEDTSLNGLVTEGGETIYYIDGVPAYMGLIENGNGGYYYINSSGKMVKSCTYWISKTNGLLEEKAYGFDADGNLIPDAPTKNGIVAENGGLYYYVDGELTYAGLIEIDGEYYYVRSNGQLAQNQKYWITKTNGLKPEQSYYFNEKGQIYTPVEIREEEDGSYYYVDGVKTYGGLIIIDGEYYYVNSSCKFVKDCTYWITKTNGLLPEGSYTFDETGKIVFDEAESFTGIKDGYYYENGKLTYAGLIEIDGAYYYVNSSCQVIMGKTYWISKTNGLLPEGSYTFDETGKMVR